MTEVLDQIVGDPQPFQDETENKLNEEEALMSRIPPDWNICEQHREAMYLRDTIDEDDEDNPKKISKNYKKCPCCNQEYDAPLYNLCVNVEELNEYGFGIPLYFKMLQYTTLLFCALIIPMIFFIIFYAQGGLENDPDEEEIYYHVGLTYYEDPILNYITPAHLRIKTLGKTMVVLILVADIFFYFVWLKLRRNLYNKDTMMDIDNLTVSDYSVRVEGFPAVDEFSEEDFLNKIFREKYGSDCITRAAFSYNIKEFSKDMTELTKKKKMKTLIDSYRQSYKKMKKRKKGIKLSDEALKEIYPPSSGLCGCGGGFEDYGKLSSEIEQMEKKMDEVYGKFDMDTLDRGNIAYVTFKYTHISDEIVDQNEYTQFDYLFNRSNTKYQNHSIFIKRAPEPEDINWENLNVTFWSKMIRVAVTWFITLVILVICFTINLYLILYARDQKEDTENNLIANAWILLSSWVCIMINKALAIFIPIFTHLEKHHTTTDYQTSVAYKLALAMLINSAFIPLIISTEISDDPLIKSFFMSGGLISSVYMNWISITFLQPFFEYFSGFYLLHKFLIWNRKRKGNNSTLTQAEANLKHEPPPINLPKKFAENILVVFYSAFYIPMFPLGIVITVLGIPFNYWADKYMMLRRYKKPARLSSHIVHYSFNLLAGFIFFSFIANTVWICLLGDEDDNNTYLYAFLPYIIFVVLSLFLQFLRYQKKHGNLKEGCFLNIYNLFLNPRSDTVEFENKFKDIPYDLIAFGRNDFYALNPITRSKAILEVIKEEMTQASEEDKEKYMKMMEEQKKMGTTNLLSNMRGYLSGGHFANAVMSQTPLINLPSIGATFPNNQIPPQPGAQFVHQYQQYGYGGYGAYGYGGYGYQYAQMQPAFGTMMAGGQSPNFNARKQNKMKKNNIKNLLNRIKGKTTITSHSHQQTHNAAQIRPAQLSPQMQAGFVPQPSVQPTQYHPPVTMANQSVIQTVQYTTSQTQHVNYQQSGYTPSTTGQPSPQSAITQQQPYPQQPRPQYPQQPSQYPQQPSQYPQQPPQQPSQYPQQPRPQYPQQPGQYSQQPGQFPQPRPQYPLQYPQQPGQPMPQQPMYQQRPNN